MKTKVNPITAKQAFEEACGWARMVRWDSYLPKLKKPIKAIESVGVTVCTDLHYGLRVDGDEVPGNQLGPQEFARRTAFLAARRVDYKPLKNQAARILLGGDMIEGEIHGRGSNAPMAEQIFEAQHCLHHMINHHVKAFGAVTVSCASGNHDRWSHRGPGRVCEGKWDSISSLIYAWLAGLHRDNPNVKFEIPRTPYTVWKAPGGEVCVLTHGDTVYDISPNNISYAKARSKTAGLSAITRKTHGKDVSLVVLGHHHSPAMFNIDDFFLVINGCLSGVAGYSQSLGYHVQKPKQLIFEQTAGHVFGHPEFCDVSLGDSMREMDRIVPPVPSVTR